MRDRLEAIKDLVLNEVNVKELVLLDPSESKLIKKIKPDFKKLGARMGKLMKHVAGAINGLDQVQISQLEEKGSINLRVEDQDIEVTLDDVEITAETVPGLSVASDGKVTVALDITLSDSLIQEGIARELVSKVQTLRKETGLEITDRIMLHIQRNGNQQFEQAIEMHAAHILAETLSLTRIDALLVAQLAKGDSTTHTVELNEELSCLLSVAKTS